MYNAQLFEAIAAELAKGQAARAKDGKISNVECAISNSQLSPESASQVSGFGFQVSYLLNVCLVPEWRVWRWPAIRKWKDAGRSTWAGGRAEGEISNSQCSSLNAQVNTQYVPVFYLPVIGRSVNSLFYEMNLRRVKEMFHKCDAVLATWLYPDAVAVARLARECGKPVWIKVHGSDTFHLRFRLRRTAILDACNYASGILPNCGFLAERLIEAGVDPAKVHVVPNGVDTQLFRYRSKEEALKELSGSRINLQLSSENKIVLFVGNLVPIKGPDILLEAFARMMSEMSNIESSIKYSALGTRHSTLLFIGAGPMRGQLERRARHLGISDSVIFLGSRPHEEVALWMNVADCLCVPSRSEGMPNVVVESLASGLPVVATDVGACRELLADESACIIVPTLKRDRADDQIEPDIAGLAAAMENRIVCPVVDRQDMALGHAARWSWTATAGSVVRLIRQMVAV